jgi:tRNA:m4X modification enzyme
MTKSPSTKKQKTIPLPPEGWDRCHAFMERKARFCRQQILPSLVGTDHSYCGNHIHLIPDPLFQPLKNGCRSEDGGGSGDAGTVQLELRRKTRRIPCPVDPTHTVMEDCVAQHILKCPKTIAEQKQAQAHYYRRDCNCGGYSSATLGDRKTASSPDTPHDLQWAQRVALRALSAHQHIFDSRVIGAPMEDGGNIATENVVAVRELTRLDVCNAILQLDLSGPELEAGIDKAVSMYRIKSGGERHLHQQASIVGHLRRIGVLDSFVRLTSASLAADNNANEINASPNVPSHCETSVDDMTSVDRNEHLPKSSSKIILELGAGRGMTGLLVAGVSAASTAVMAGSSQCSTRLIMVERSASRSRAEKCLRKAKKFGDAYAAPSDTLKNDSTAYPLLLSLVQWDRIHCDLAHVDMKAVLARHGLTAPNQQGERESSPQEIVVVAKHLCGVGTDLALKSLESIRDKVTACVMTTCCHGVCSWKDYVGRDFLVAVMVEHDGLGQDKLSSFSDIEFELLRQWSSGTVKHIVDTDLDRSKERGSESIEGDADLQEHDNEHGTGYGYLRETDPGGSCQALPSIAEVVDSLRLRCGVQGLGRASQRLIDYGRREYLRRVIFQEASSPSPSPPVHSELLHYVPETVTPQNAALIAYRR